MVWAGCGGGSKGGGGDFFLVEFLEAGQDAVPRNRALTFVFSAPLRPTQDFAERLKIENVQTGPNSNFARAIGMYTVNGERAFFTPRLPERNDRGDAGFRANANYHVFVKGGGPDALTSASGDIVERAQDFTFDTSEFFEDPTPADPPRVIGMFARDATTGDLFDLSRVDPSAAVVALLDSDALVQAGRIIEPGAGGAPNYATPWQFDLFLSEPIDPATITRSNIVMYEIRNDALTTADSADPGHVGTAVNFKVPIQVRAFQRPNALGVLEFIVRITPVQTLVDDARYRISWSGQILGIDFRKVFIGDNGLTGESPEPGGLGYSTEFLVYDRPSISQSRTVTYDPVVDGIQPENGQTALSEDDWNSALYNPVTSPSTAVGFLSAFGQGNDGDLAVSGGSTVTIDTGDTLNDPVGNPFQVLDLNPDDDYLGNPLPGRLVTWDSPEYYELELTNLTVSTSSTLKVVGVNPLLLRVTGIAQVAGTLDVSGSAGVQAGSSVAAGGVGGPGGFAGGNSKRGAGTCTNTFSCSDFQVYLNACSSATFPNSFNGFGPGRGYAGGEVYNYDYSDDRNNSTTGTGGGGGGHAVEGGDGEDRMNPGGAVGTAGNACSSSGIRTSGIIGVRGQGGTTYGDSVVESILFGGSGGGAGGAVQAWGGAAKAQAGGGGGGGGGSVAIISAGPILLSGGTINARGGAGGKGFILAYSVPNNWYSVAGGGGGGAGGTVALISGNAIDVAGGTLDARGGPGGARGDQQSGTCNGCNAGGDGGKGFIFLMDADGQMPGLIPGLPGDYPGYANGLLAIRAFDASRFSSITAITELFGMTAANPAYLPLAPADVKGNLNDGQRIFVRVSSARGDPDDPLAPDPTSEIPDFEVAVIEFTAGGSAVSITGNMSNLNPGAAPNREAFVRVRALFDYNSPVEAALGPFAAIDQVTISYSFN